MISVHTIFTVAVEYALGSVIRIRYWIWMSNFIIRDEARPIETARLDRRSDLCAVVLPHTPQEWPRHTMSKAIANKGCACFSCSEVRYIRIGTMTLRVHARQVVLVLHSKAQRLSWCSNVFPCSHIQRLQEKIK
jgi:hypothetical protein